MLKTENVKVPYENRDSGKIFKITEMPAADAEKWAMKAFIVLKGTSGEVPPEIMQLGMVAVAWQGFNAFLAADVDPDRLIPLMDEMMTCIKRVRDHNHPEVATGLLGLDIEEVQTRLWLRSEVLRVHTGFSVADAVSSLVSAIKPPVP